MNVLIIIKAQHERKCMHLHLKRSKNTTHFIIVLSNTCENGKFDVNAFIYKIDQNRVKIHYFEYTKPKLENAFNDVHLLRKCCETDNEIKSNNKLNFVEFSENLQ